MEVDPHSEMKCFKQLSAGLLAAAFAATVCAASEPADREDVLVGRVRAVMAEMLHRLPDYTCVETIERSTRPSGTEKFHQLDRVRVEVAYFKGSELYAWPGATRFEARDLADMVGGEGAIGTGDFALHLMATYRGPAPLHFAGRDTVRGRAALKFTQTVPIALSTFKVGTPERFVVGYEVTAWHDAQSLALLRFELLVTQFPPGMPLRKTFKAIDYEEVTVGGSVFRLPVGTELSMVHVNGVENRTISRFARCRQYLGESTITFGDMDEGAAPAAQRTQGSLPAGVKVAARLSQETELADTARGDLLEMAVTQNVVSKGRTVLARGARLSARVEGVFCGMQPYAHCFVLVKGENYEDASRAGSFVGSLEQPTLESLLQQNQKLFRGEQRMRIPDQVVRTAQDVSVLFAGGANTKLPRGYPLIWRTLEVLGGSRP